MTPKQPWRTIEQGHGATYHNDTFTVYEHSTYGRSSVGGSRGSGQETAEAVTTVWHVRYLRDAGAMCDIIQEEDVSRHE